MPRPIASCGTPSGYSRHRDRREQPCEPCRIANSRYQREKRRNPPDFMQPQPRILTGPILPRADWMERAACRDVNPDWFFSEESEEIEAALRVCSRCDLHLECLRYAIETNSEGIWGGYKPSEIDRLRKVRTA